MGGLLTASSILCVAAIVAGVAPAVANASCASPSAGASGAVCSFSLTPSNLTAGSDPSISSSIVFNYGTNTTDSVKSLTVTLPPGLFASLGALTQLCTPAQLAAKSPMLPSCPPGSQIGSGSLTTSLAPNMTLQVKLFMMPAPNATDAAGVGTEVTFDNFPVATTTGYVAEAVINGAPVLQLVLPALPDTLGKLGFQVNMLNFTINGTAMSTTGTPTSTPFTRLPTNCATATATLSVQTYQATSANGGGSSSFTPVGCSSLAFTPSMTASATMDTGDPGVTFISTVASDPTQAAVKSLALEVPAATLAEDEFNAGHLFNQTVGSATAVTPLVPTPLVGTVTLTGSISAPALTVSFPPPFSLSFSGAIDLLNDSVTFGSVPDVPLNSLTLKIPGGATTALYYTTCLAPTGTLKAAFVAQNGATASASVPLTISNCTTAPVPTVVKLSGGSAKGFATGSAKLGFGLTTTSGTGLVSSFTVSLPKGVKFNAKTYKHGVTVSGAKIEKASLSHGRLVVSLRSAVKSLSVKLSPTAMSESAALQKKIKSHKVKSLSAKVVAKDTTGKTTSLTLKLKV